MGRSTTVTTGMRIGRLTVVARLANETGKTIALFRCRCDCGIFCVVVSHNLKDHATRPSTKSCGCLQREKTTTRNTTHGMRDRAEYSIWSGMRQRCENKNTDSYAFYGGVGVSVSKRWIGKRGFANFLSDIGPRPSRRHSIDRFPDPSGNYEPGNVRWATPRQQRMNRRPGVRR